MDLLNVETLKIKETNFPVEQLIKNQKKIIKAIRELEDYFEEFDRTDFKGRMITWEYYRYKDGLPKLKEYLQKLEKQIDEKKQLKGK